MRILLTGSTGQVGWELQRSLMTLGEVICAGREATSVSLQMDLSVPETIRAVIREVKPNLIINPAAYTAVDKAEAEPELAMAVNGVAPGIIAEEAKLLDAPVIHYSTDYVFNGTQATAYTEQDIPDPQNVYGKTKLAGEKAIQAVGVPYLILRTSWVYGLRGKNFLLTMLKLSREREELKVVDDQIGAPTWSRMIAEATTHIISGTRELVRDYSGVYHLTATNQTSWHGFAKTIFELDPNSGQQKLKQLLAIPSTEYPTPAKRPAYSSLDTSKISSTFKLALPSWRESLALVLDSRC
ncbi:NAD(P)-dependent oxidoreductase [Dulcicalothrix desertica PCC 7102]|uniref:dTDP-4-dehydrorhamnose reductase n=1 Tax=Dulcicalothrix desertica PCC 7102 TaxID=232991 RepID=A0A3S1AGV5_9CYAN|nr:dTDP-4-dehydrorhamnose reductase [Dulcicalothrix desertica]RUT00216.1 NAD(P)-dependent oxidoreductase [Dulcicalothrix desertica PCC 7102]TWH55684.1 dTDP-4-dehydrorhamnose reductase [Dulcicalothrix desertica PCC 7102]